MHPLYLLISSWNLVYINSRVCFGSAGSWKIWPRISRTCPLPDSSRHLGPLAISLSELGNYAAAKFCMFIHRSSPRSKRVSLWRECLPPVLPNPPPHSPSQHEKILCLNASSESNNFFGIFIKSVPPPFLSIFNKNSVSTVHDLIGRSSFRFLFFFLFVLSSLFSLSCLNNFYSGVRANIYFRSRTRLLSILKILGVAES